MHPKHPITVGDVKNNPASPLGYETRHDLGSPGGHELSHQHL